MKLALCGLVVFAQIAQASLDKYSSLVVTDKNPQAAASPNSIRVTYLGVNGFQFENGRHSLLVDPYFSRIGLFSAALNRPIHSDPNRVSEGVSHVRSNIDAILVTHAHFDHLLDVPKIMQRKHARLIAGPTAVRLVESFDIPPNECDAVEPGSARRIGPWTVRVFAAQHDRLLGKIPFAGKSTSSKPIKASDWTVGEPLAFVIEAARKRIYIDSGGVPGAPLDARVGDARHGESVHWRIDLAILGVALPDSRQRFAEVVGQLRPQYVLPSHQDDMFAPINRGFVFGRMTNFPWLLRDTKKENLPGRLVLLDYFKPWTLS